jgi:hypothetical protein
MQHVKSYHRGEEILGSWDDCRKLLRLYEVGQTHRLELEPRDLNTKG